MSVTHSRPVPPGAERPRTRFVASAPPLAAIQRRGRDLAEQFRSDPRTYRRLLIVLAGAMIAFSIAPLANNLRGIWNKDYDLWYMTGWVVLQGGDIYPGDARPFPFMYPPAAASLLAIVSLVGHRLFVPVLLVANSVAWIVSILLSVRLATGKALHQDPILYALPTFVLLPFIHDMYLLGQPNLFLLLLMLGAFTGLRARRPWLAGSLLGLAAAIKAFPILALGYLVYRRQWRATAATLLSLTLLLLVLPLPLRGVSKTWSDMVIWTRGMVLKYDAGQIAQRPERSYSFKNQSLVAVANRLLRAVPADGEANDGWRVNVADLSFKAVNGVVLAAALGLGLFFIVAMPRGRQRDDRNDAAETAMLLLMILVFSPFAFNYFYVWLMYPLTVLLSRWCAAEPGAREARVLRAGMLAALAFYGATLVSVKTSQAYGNLFAVDLILLGLLGWTLLRDRAAARAETQSLVGM
jgi:hypothetical protein